MVPAFIQFVFRGGLVAVALLDLIRYEQDLGNRWVGMDSRSIVNWIGWMDYVFEC